MTAPPSALGGEGTEIPITISLPPEGAGGLMGPATSVVVMATRAPTVAFLLQLFLLLLLLVLLLLNPSLLLFTF